jgi:hypothetical protein
MIQAKPCSGNSTVKFTFPCGILDLVAMPIFSSFEHSFEHGNRHGTIEANIDTQVREPAACRSAAWAAHTCTRTHAARSRSTNTQPTSTFCC